MRKNLIFILLLVICLVSCDKHHMTIGYFVCSYHGISELELKQVDKQIVRVDYSVGSVGFSDCWKKNVSTFEKLAAKHGDKGFNKKIEWVGPAPTILSYQNVDFTAINIFTENDYNSSHLASSSLNDIVCFLGRSTYPFIKSKYQLNRTDDIRSRASEIWKKYVAPDLISSSYGFGSYTPFTPVEKLLYQLTSEDLVLIGGGIAGLLQYRPTLCFLYFTELPEVPGTYDFRVEFVADDGKTYTGSISMEM